MNSPQSNNKETTGFGSQNRDPNDLNRSIAEVTWEEIIGEPENYHSPELVWKISNQCFQISRTCCYTFLTALCAPLTALCLGFTFACKAFETIWCNVPCLRLWKISCRTTRSFVTPCMEAITVPCCESMGTYWSKIKIQKQNFDINRKEDVIPI